MTTDPNILADLIVNLQVENELIRSLLRRWQALRVLGEPCWACQHPIDHHNTCILWIVLNKPALTTNEAIALQSTLDHPPARAQRLQ